MNLLKNNGSNMFKPPISQGMDSKFEVNQFSAFQSDVSAQHGDGSSMAIEGLLCHEFLLEDISYKCWFILKHV